MPFQRLAVPAFLILAFASSGRAEIVYRLTPQPSAKRVRIEMTIPVIGKETVVQMPRWHPGWYVLQNQTKELKEFAAVDGSGKPLTTTTPDDHTWQIANPKSGTVRVSYTLPAEENAGGWRFNGPAIYMYVVGRKEEDCRLKLDLPTGWRAAVGLPGEGPEYKAPDYDVLADNPITTGQYREIRYTTGGKLHILALIGAARNELDGKQLAKTCQSITETQAAYFGGLPYPKYVWHFSVGEGENWAGGLEHLSSTTIGFGKKMGWRTVGVFSHEFFHLWNVKRIRSKPLGPFDYQKLPKTGALWWLEGVTDYYSGLLLRRGGLYDDSTFFKHVIAAIDGQRRNPERFKVSPHESSLRVDETNDGKGNSDGFGVSYYDTGYLAGLVLDLELRHRTGGLRSLDDVTLALWRQYRPDRPGFEEDEIRRQVVLAGGPSMGDFYDRVVHSPGELPIEEAFRHVGLTLNKSTRDDPSLGFETTFDGTRLIVSKINGESDLKVGDVLTIDGTDFRQLRREAKIGSTVELKVLRDGQEIAVKQTVRAAPVVTWSIALNPDATPDQIRLREGWLSKTGRTAPAQPDGTNTLHLFPRVSPFN